jgi:hypothetical protein
MEFDNTNQVSSLSFRETGFFEDQTSARLCHVIPSNVHGTAALEGSKAICTGGCRYNFNGLVLKFVCVNKVEAQKPECSKKRRPDNKIRKKMMRSEEYQNSSYNLK